jgi:hypothetical protein
MNRINMKNRNKIEQVPKVITTRLRTVKIKVVKIVLPNKLFVNMSPFLLKN